MRETTDSAAQARVRYYVEIATRGKVVLAYFAEAETMAQAFDLAWEAFDPDGEVDFLDTSHNAWMTEVGALGPASAG